MFLTSRNFTNIAKVDRGLELNSCVCFYVLKIF